MYQTSKLDTLNLNNVVCQLYLNKAGGKKENNNNNIEKMKPAYIASGNGKRFSCCDKLPGSSSEG